MPGAKGVEPAEKTGTLSSYTTRPMATTPPATAVPTHQAEFINGVKAELPIVVGVVPFGLIFGVLALAAGLPPLLAQAMSSIIFAGSAQFIAVQLIGVGTPAAVLLLTTFIVNLRHLLYSASVAPHLHPLSPLWRWLLAYLLTDEAYAVVALRYGDHNTPAANKHWFFLGAGLTLWLSWQLSTAAGILLGAQVPATWSLDFTLALTFIGIVVPALKHSGVLDRPNAAAALSAGIVAVLAGGLPLRLGLMAAAITGIVVGLLLENRNTKRKT